LADIHCNKWIELREDRRGTVQAAKSSIRLGQELEKLAIHLDRGMGGKGFGMNAAYPHDPGQALPGKLLEFRVRPANVSQFNMLIGEGRGDV